MESSEQMATLSQVMEKISQRGITREFRMNDSGEMKFENSGKNYLPSDLSILKTYRFEGDSSPDDNAVLYIVKDTDGNLGMIIDSYGADSNYSGEDFDAFLRDIPVHESDEFNL
ncbi:hypothetical protein HNP38_002616 [Chryseobacterium defluvii]|uniref:Phosphoribosylpyrophosphate synthetase n=1 Tax=Chryseobacterium defluvii TaxID=160396 RepID=A0A840KKC3_9FLAO|nr:hypothetical protein [Chryseobacterium defluvii]MBB4807312.1 hypothetical protein [Chryseobacterium defluvii]